ncbi:MAG: Crp/Fnr family transcriptional regulator [Hydrogenophaga sp.]|uniref:Crp/Fnr family transcriptional regulator n=1 Tax=Hydrogenophaga sp. TaxID=1904254 RepID=UPI00261E034F|nr:Crp/Fnr family transcriptional regulator [Hydrogenophaga sp.]MCW5671125.1 Crp/Fnr family transcriptional regulator [Hydrogenophaga sp.]
MKQPTAPTDASSGPPPRCRSRCNHCATLRVCLMGCLPDASRERLSSCIEESAFTKGDALQLEGIVAQRISIIKIGAVMATRQGEDGQPHPVALLGRGKTLGGYAIYGHQEQIGAQALSTGRVCSVDVPDFYRVGVVNRQFHACIQTHIVEAHGQLADWSRVMRIKGLQQKLLATLQLYAREQRTQAVRLPSHVALAALLSTTRETIARSLRQLEAAGHILRHDRWHCEVVKTRGGDEAPATA